MNIEKYQIGLGGGCHWCTEGVFQSLIGINEVKQGWISAIESPTFSEAIIVDYNPETISAKDLIEIHLHTHSSTSNHSMRDKYRSAVYAFTENEKKEYDKIIDDLQCTFGNKLITKVYSFQDFKLNKEDYLNYLYTKEDNQFCKNYIHPKLSLLMQKFSSKVNKKQINKLNISNL
jgi:peptide-methionine (S)-S-oxide reductase